MASQTMTYFGFSGINGANPRTTTFASVPYNHPNRGIVIGWNSLKNSFTGHTVESVFLGTAADPFMYDIFNDPLSDKTGNTSNEGTGSRVALIAWAPHIGALPGDDIVVTTTMTGDSDAGKIYLWYGDLGEKRDHGTSANAATTGAISNLDVITDGFIALCSISSSTPTSGTLTGVTENEIEGTSNKRLAGSTISASTSTTYTASKNWGSGLGEVTIAVSFDVPVDKDTTLRHFGTVGD